jgi:threonine-phosphate decarboxylase
MNAEDLVRRPLKDLPHTVHGGQAWRLSGVEDYSHNLNPLGPPDVLPGIIMSATAGIGHYPDDSCSDLKNVISNVYGVDKDCIIIGSGSSDIIRMFPNTFLNEGDRVLIPRPSFAEYSHQCRIIGAEVVDSLLLESDDFHINYDSFVSQIGRGVRAVYVCNPNNPTGSIEPREKILALADECLRKNVLLFLDETLLELVPGCDRISCVKDVKDHPNMVVTHSLTKSFAIPGIRIGYAFGAPDIIRQMDKVRMTWNVGQIEQYVAKILIRDHMDYVKKAADMMHEEVTWLYARLKEIGFPVTTPTDSYFFFNSLHPLNVNAATFNNRMLDSKIMVRDCASFGRPFDWYIRFCVKDRMRDTAFLQAAHDSLRSLGW